MDMHKSAGVGICVAPHPDGQEKNLRNRKIGSNLLLLFLLFINANPENNE